MVSSVAAVGWATKQRERMAQLISGMPRYLVQCNTTSTPSTFEPLATTDPPSTEFSHESWANEAGRDTKSLVGEATSKRPFKLKLTPTILPTSSKRSMESESSGDSSTSDISSSSKSAKKQRQSKHNNSGAAKVPTEHHLKIRAVVDAGSSWELDLERVHGLTDEDACVVVSKMARYVNQAVFPDPNGDRFMEFAKEGWKHMRELKRIKKLYPECRDQTCIDGQWFML
jgi:hypothetical protein